jgi:sugar lactone lactonase YvrE
VISLRGADIDVFREERSVLAENLVFHDGVLLWSDISTGTLHRSPLGGARDGRDDVVTAFGPPLSALAPTDTGDLLLAFVNLIVIARTGEELVPLTSIPHRTDRMRFNEGKCDPRGRFVIGSMDYTGQADGAIYSVTADGTWRTLIAGIGVANGFEWSADGTRMYFADTAASTLYVGDYSENGELVNVESFVRGQSVDGLAKDVDGGFWAGINGDGVVRRFDADGRQTLEVQVPAGHVTAVTFGGPDLSTLFIATARENLSEAELRAQPQSGSNFALTTGTHGYPPHLFNTVTGTAGKGNHHRSGNFGT